MRELFKRWDNRNVIASPRSHWIPIHFPKPATVHLRPFTSTSPASTAFVSWKSSYRVRERQLWKFKFLFLTSPLCQTPSPSWSPLSISHPVLTALPPCLSLSFLSSLLFLPSSFLFSLGILFPFLFHSPLSMLVSFPFLLFLLYSSSFSSLLSFVLSPHFPFFPFSSFSLFPRFFLSSAFLHSLSFSLSRYHALPRCERREGRIAGGYPQGHVITALYFTNISRAWLMTFPRGSPADKVMYEEWRSRSDPEEAARATVRDERMLRDRDKITRLAIFQAQIRGEAASKSLWIFARSFTLLRSTDEISSLG